MSLAEQINQDYSSVTILPGADKHQANSVVCAEDAEVLSRIYDEHINMAVLQRSLGTDVQTFCLGLTLSRPAFNLRVSVKSEEMAEALQNALPQLTGQVEFIEDLQLLADMYACLFDLEEVGLRLQVIDRAMCPRFHVDKLGCRLVSTYKGAGTEWLCNEDVDRTKLGRGSNGLSDRESGLFKDPADIRKLSEGDIILLKGEGWPGNEGLGAVHRSPDPDGEKRVVVTLDFA